MQPFVIHLNICMVSDVATRTHKHKHEDAL